MPIVLDGTAGIDNDATDLSYTGTLTGGTGVVNLGSGQVYKDASGNVGIGTSSPNSYGGQTALTINGSSYSRVDFNTGGTKRTSIYSEGFSNLIFETASSERARIDSSGNLLVGRTTNVSAGARIATTYNANAGNWGMGIQASVQENGTAIGFVNTSGTTVGTISQGPSSTAYNTSSDYRLKHDIQPMTGALAKVALLKPVTYKWNHDNSEDEGFIAHELQEVCPSAVTGEKDAVDAEGNPQYQGIDTSFLVATLTAALQELKAINDAQAQIITAQQAALESLTARVVALEGQA